MANTFLRRNFTQGLFYAGMIVLSAFVMVNVHEIGHTILARLSGDSHATYALYRLNSNGDLSCIGCNVYDETALSWAGNVMVALGGVLFSQALAMLVLGLGGRRKFHWCWRFCQILVAVCALDAVFQVLQGILAHVSTQTNLTRVDLADFVWLVSGRTGVSAGVIKMALGIILIAYLWWLMSAYKKMTGNAEMAH